MPTTSFNDPSRAITLFKRMHSRLYSTLYSTMKTMKTAKLSDYFIKEEKTKELSLIWADLFKRASDDGVSELQVTPKEFRILYAFAQANDWLSDKEDGVYILGVKLNKQ